MTSASLKVAEGWALALGAAGALLLLAPGGEPTVSAIQMPQGMHAAHA
ncbi:hypothetical protein [Nonomuraea solani]|nr:hypothetical protein [Nonomuraea solani]